VSASALSLLYELTSQRRFLLSPHPTRAAAASAAATAVAAAAATLPPLPPPLPLPPPPPLPLPLPLPPLLWRTLHWPHQAQRRRACSAVSAY
jgi:hypothetical protein